MHRASYVWIQIARHELFNGHCLNVSISTRICEAKQKKLCAVCIVRGSGRVGLSRCKWIFEVRAVCRPPGLLSRSCSAFPSHQSSQVSQGIQIYLCTPTLSPEISFSEPHVYCSSQPSMVDWLSSSIFPFSVVVLLWWHPTKSPLFSIYTGIKALY